MQDHSVIFLLDKCGWVWYNNDRKRSLALAQQQLLRQNNNIICAERLVDLNLKYAHLSGRLTLPS